MDTVYLITGISRIHAPNHESRPELLAIREAIRYRTQQRHVLFEESRLFELPRFPEYLQVSPEETPVRVCGAYKWRQCMSAVIMLKISGYLNVSLDEEATLDGGVHLTLLPPNARIVSPEYFEMFPDAKCDGER